MDTRLFWFLVGCAIGTVFGYIVRSLREIKDKVDIVDNHITNEGPHDSGTITLQRMKDALLLLVVVLTVYAAFASQRSSDKVTKQQDTISQTQNELQNEQTRTDKIVSCNQQFLTSTITALNERTKFTLDQATANIKLQKSFATLIGLLLAQPALTPEAATAAVQKYFNDLTNFIEIATKSSSQVERNPYPTPADFQKCLNT